MWFQILWHGHSGRVSVENRQVRLSPDCCEKYDAVLTQGGTAQEALMYHCEHATGEMGKLPEVALRSCVLAWCFSFLAGAPDCKLELEHDANGQVINACIELQGRHMDACLLISVVSMNQKLCFLRTFVRASSWL